MGVRIAVEHYGCTMNQGEAASAARLLGSLGHEVVIGPEQEGPGTSEAVLIFTCDVIASTEKRMWARMSEVASSGRRLFVAGCLAAISPERIKTEFPDAMVLDTMGIEALKVSVEASFGRPWSRSAQEMTRVPKRLDHIVPISNGCMGKCTYCITKVARGALVSNSLRSVLEMVRGGVDTGRKEILLTSQDTAVYGADIVDGGTDLGALLRSITTTVTGDHMVRVGMMNPSSLMARERSILDGFEGSDIFKFFHLPVQSGSDVIIASMGREYNVGAFLGLIGRIRECHPDAVISTDLIVGFPGETEEDHRMNMDLVGRLLPEVLNITRFSARPGTPASLMPSQVHGRISKERSRELTDLHRDLMHQMLRRRLGRHSRCLVTEIGKRPGTLMARDRNYLPIVIGSAEASLGDLVDIRSERCGPTYLIGEVL